MAVRTRAKFKVQTVTRRAHMQGVEVELSPVYSADPDSENKAFWDATPNGKLTMTITNPRAAEVFELGRDYYIDFTPADD